MWDKRASKVLSKVVFWDDPDDADSVNSRDYFEGNGWGDGGRYRDAHASGSVSDGLRRNGV